MDRLSVVLTFATGPVLMGGLVIIVMSFGLYSWTPLLIAAGIGFVLSWPVAYVISRRIKRRDPDWHREAEPEILPDPNAPEV